MRQICMRLRCVLDSMTRSHSSSLAYEQDGSTSLILSVMNGHVECMRLLLDAGADKNAINAVRVSRICRVRIFACHEFLFALIVSMNVFDFFCHA
jgi:hypothetical protein